MITYNDQLDAIERQFFDLGLEFPAPLEFGKVVRVKLLDDKAGKKNGWYVCHEFKLDNGNIAITGTVGNWKLADKGQPIAVDWKGLSQDERAKLALQAAEQKKAAAAEQKKLQLATQQRAQTIWQKLPQEGKSDYLQAKKVAAFGLRFSRGSVVVPLVDINGTLCNLQFIDPQGNKRFLTGGKKQGCFHKFGAMTDNNTLLVAEGYSTAASVHMATGLPVVVAFDCGNLKPVTVALRQKLPDCKIIIAADNDAATKDNPGITKAAEAATAALASFVAPDFSSSQGGACPA